MKQLILTTILTICALAQSAAPPVMPDLRLTPGDVLDVTARSIFSEKYRMSEEKPTKKSRSAGWIIERGRRSRLPPNQRRRKVTNEDQHTDCFNSEGIMKREQKELREEYKQTPPPMGVFQIRNLTTEQVFLGASLNLPGIFNRHRFALQAGKHANARLQADWNALGAAGFAFEILDELDATGEPGRDYRADLAALEEMWLEKMHPYEERGYNEPELSQAERLSLIAKRRQERAGSENANETE